MAPLVSKLFLTAVLALLMNGCTDAGSARVDAPSGTEPSFSSVAVDAGLADFRHVNGAFGEKWFPETMGSGGAFLDYDGDGRLDILLVGGGTWPGHGDPVPALRLYRNDGAGSFAEQTEEAGLVDLVAYGMGTTVADYDNDGDQDVFFTTVGRDYLLRNDGGTFVDVAEEVGVAGPPTWSTAAIFFDPDRDGDLDLYVGGYTKWSPESDVFCSLDGENKTYCTPHAYEGIPARYYENDGEGRFQERTQAAGFLTTPQKTLGVAQLDYNRDGWPDLIVANDMQPDRLYRNRGNGTFLEEGLATGIALGPHGRAFNGMGVDAGVVDSTGDVTIFVGNFSGQPIGVFRYEKSGFFRDRVTSSHIGPPSMPTLTFGLLLLDADLDGDLDLYAANGHVQPEVDAIEDGVSFRQPPHLFLNDGDGTFVDVAPHMPDALGAPLVGRGAAAGDFDGDGDLDLLVTENGGPVRLFRNDLPSKHYVRIKLEGRQSNRDGIGARVVAITGDRRQYRMVSTGSTYLSQSEKTVTFGLGEYSAIDSLLIYWPSGTSERLHNVRANQELVIKEQTTSAAAENGSSTLRRESEPLADL